MEGWSLSIMKKLIIALISILTLLTACTSNNEGNASAENAEEDIDTALSVENKEADKEEISTKEAYEETESRDQEIGNFPEYDVLAEQVDLDNLTSDIKTDNPNKRVMILTEGDGQKRYKSIYIKKKQRLKIISLDDEGQIFNEVIK